MGFEEQLVRNTCTFCPPGSGGEDPTDRNEGIGGDMHLRNANVLNRFQFSVE